MGSYRPHLTIDGQVVRQVYLWSKARRLGRPFFEQPRRKGRAVIVSQVITLVFHLLQHREHLGLIEAVEPNGRGPTFVLPEHIPPKVPEHLGRRTGLKNHSEDR